MENTRKPLLFSKTVALPGGGQRPRPGAANGRPRILPAERLGNQRDLGDRPWQESDQPEEAGLEAPAGRIRLEPLIREWLLDLQVMGRSPRTIDWYRQKMRWYLEHGEAQSLAELTAYELKRYLAELQSRGLAENTVHGAFETIKVFCNWAARENYPVDLALLRVRAPKVAVKEMETYSEAEQREVLKAAAPGWARMAVEILLGTGMRVGELCGLTIDDVEDDGEVTFLKIRRGKGAKFRQVPVTRQLRRELVR